jgi:hypothetical protein
VSIIFFSKKGRHYRSFLPREEQDKPGHGQTGNLIDLLYSIQYNSFISICIVIQTSQDVTNLKKNLISQVHVHVCIFIDHILSTDHYNNRRCIDL